MPPRPVYVDRGETGSTVGRSGYLSCAMRALPVAADLVLLAAAQELVPAGTFSAPVCVAAPPGDDTRLFVVERAGRERGRSSTSARRRATTASAGCCRWRSRPTAPRAGASTSSTPTSASGPDGRLYVSIGDGAGNSADRAGNRTVLRRTIRVRGQPGRLRGSITVTSRSRFTISGSPVRSGSCIPSASATANASAYERGCRALIRAAARTSSASTSSARTDSRTRSTAAAAAASPTIRASM